jgi:hypothetical protein
VSLFEPLRDVRLSTNKKADKMDTNFFMIHRLYNASKDIVVKNQLCQPIVMSPVIKSFSFGS